jgi:drug/metabolite transporter (DMT)-like permease
MSATAFGTMAVLADHAHANGLNVPTLMLLRFGIAALLLGAVAAIRGERFPRGKNLAWLSGMGAGLYFGQSLCFFTALRYIPAATTSLLLYLYPVFVTVLSVAFLGERMTGAKALALGLALLGTVLTIGPVSGSNAVGIALAIGSALLYSLYIFAGARYEGPHPPVVTTATVLGSTAVSYALLTAFQGPSPVSLPALGWGAALALVSVVAVGGFLAGLSTVSPVDASILSALEPIVTALTAALFLSQRLTPSQILGGVIVLVGVVVLVRTSRREEPEPGISTGSSPVP